MISMLKVLKFGGSSLADAHQFAKVKSIVDADPARRVVIVSARFDLPVPVFHDSRLPPEDD